MAKELEQMELFPKEEGQVNGSTEPIAIEKEFIQDAEWCFQFFNNEPVVFGWSNIGAEPSPLTVQINPVENEGLVFNQNGMAFRIFARPISEESKKQRELENESQNQEVTSESSNS